MPTRPHGRIASPSDAFSRSQFPAFLPCDLPPSPPRAHSPRDRTDSEPRLFAFPPKSDSASGATTPKTGSPPRETCRCIYDTERDGRYSGFVVGAKISWMTSLEGILDSSSEGSAKANKLASGLKATLHPDPNTETPGIRFSGFYSDRKGEKERSCSECPRCRSADRDRGSPEVVPRGGSARR